MRLNVKAFAISCALIWGLGLFFLTWWIIAFDGSSDDATFIGQVYRGYSISPLGSVIGLAWALVDGLIGGAIFAWLYNLVLGLVWASPSSASHSSATDGAGPAQA